MDRTNIEKYYASLMMIKKMKNDGLLSDDDFTKAESIIADKYCIKIGNLYRSNDLLLSSLRGNMNSEKEVVSNECNEDRRITKIDKVN